MDKGDYYYNRNRRKALNYYRQARIVKIEAGATKINKHKFNINLKIVFKSFFGFLKKLCSLIIVLIKLIFQRKQNSKKSK